MSPVLRRDRLSVGELVLVKADIFPAWPAWITRPKDWKKTPDPKKYCVQFFATEEIAFVAPADIQVFTSEFKDKLLAWIQGKEGDFVQAVKEICEAFDDNQELKCSGYEDETDDNRISSEAPSVDGAVGNPKDATNVGESHAEKDNIYVDNVGSNLDDFMQNTREKDSRDAKLIELQEAVNDLNATFLKVQILHEEPRAKTSSKSRDETEFEWIKSELMNIADSFRENTAALTTILIEHTAAYEKAHQKLPIPEAEIWKLLEDLQVEDHLFNRAYLYLLDHPERTRGLLGCPKNRKKLLMEMLDGYSVGSSSHT